MTLPPFISLVVVPYAQMESAKRPRKATLAKIPAALGLEVEQLNF